MGLQEVRSTDDRHLQDIADILASSHKVIVVTGAGISTSCGIPDFRSKDGLYNIIPEQALLPTPPASQPSTPTLKRTISMVEEDDFPSSQASSASTTSRRASTSPSSKLRGQDLFDSRVFQDVASTRVFYQFIASLRQKIRDEVRATSSVHKFLRVLRDGGRLMRCYTQNIDGLETREGLVTDLTRGKGNKRRFMKKHYESPRPGHVQGTDFDAGCEVVQLHGDLQKLRCTMCAVQYEWTDEETDIYLEGAAPNCQKCKAKSEERMANGKRGLAVGCLRPNIVLYGEDHPSNTLLTPLIPFDASCQPEVMIIMGTSLKVFGLQKMVREFAKAVHAHKNGKGKVVFVNRTRPAESVWEGTIDDFVCMDCDDWVDDLRTRRSDLWLRQGEIDMTVTKPSQPRKKRKSVMAEDEIENQPTKKTKVVVEIPRVAHPPHGIPLQNPMQKIMSTPSKPRFPLALGNYARGILSPLAQAKRPPISPLTSPVRPDDDDVIHQVRSPAKRTTPQAPMFSPITPNEHPGSNLKLQILPDEVVLIDDDDDDDDDDDEENNNTTTEETPTHRSLSRPGASDTLKKPMKKAQQGRNIISPATMQKKARHSTRKTPGLVAQLWQFITDERPPSSQPRSPVSEVFEREGESEGDAIEVVCTPTKGPRARKIDVFAG
ncbi:uncharacterized protein A1O9_05435 [Exophiala aquamarina CBS 119918]|uniref:Deacetylase sirtuin-type domain-containing protein n=1 Tax=Exophiala aquamarina CBS 119918 TaxID=1182545 RepID=A0A072PDY5_9EURO|nr:uncharacterized protein A1O9_05435 [Exophiala aquamarina CBS 119918]KEF57518.1 hypothetical protein A1O9_05435 [Exophiala aquamarina CBS 119918]